MDSKRIVPYYFLEGISHDKPLILILDAKNILQPSEDILDTRYYVIQGKVKHVFEHNGTILHEKRLYHFQFSRKGFERGIRFCFEKPDFVDNADILEVSIARPSKNNLIFLKMEAHK